MRILPLLVTTLLFATAARAQTGQLEIVDGSLLTIAGTSTVHAWTCRTTQLGATLEVNSTAMGLLGLGGLSKVSVTIPVRSLKCGHGRMDGNLYKAMKADEHPSIAYTLGHYELLPDGTRDSVTLRTTGSLTIAGTAREITMDVRASRVPEGNIVRGTGRVQLRMTSFGIKPPVVMMGMLKTGDEITVSFDLRTRLTAAVAAAWDATLVNVATR